MQTAISPLSVMIFTNGFRVLVLQASSAWHYFSFQCKSKELFRKLQYFL